MALNTVKTVLGFLRGSVEKLIPALNQSKRIEDIYNFHSLENLYATSGQPNEKEFQLIKEAGYEVVINLAPQSKLENSLIDEAGILKRLGIQYLHIPVNFQKPSEAKFQLFVDAVEQNKNKKLWIHCAANMRVSAFTYRYRRAYLGVSELEAKQDLAKIWEPFGAWERFVKKEKI